MCNSYKTVSEILDQYKELESVSVILKNADHYLAHTPGHAGMPTETLSEHLKLVLSYFQKLVDIHQLDPVIDQLIQDYLHEIGVTSKETWDYIKILFVHSICYHDHGKVNENFQASPEKMNNPLFRGKENPDNGIDTQHSTLSAFIFLSHKVDEIVNQFHDGEKQNCTITLAILFSYSIYRHHSSHLKNDFWDKILFESKRAEVLKPYLEVFSRQLKNNRIVEFISKLEAYKTRNSFDPYEHSFALYQLLRLHFSLLTASDYLATHEYMNGTGVKDFGTLSGNRIAELFQRVSRDKWMDEDSGKINFNQKTYEELDRFSLEKPTDKGNASLNILRQQMATEAIRNIRRNIGKRIFYLEAPTGGGKTNMSLLLALELLKANPVLNKVYYVFPFTTLIDQSFKSIKESLGLSDREIVALHSKAAFYPEQETEDDRYGARKENYINRLFAHYPFSLLSHIRFFEILKSNAKETNYLLHRLAHSVVIIDELQTYDPRHWDKVMYFIRKYAEVYDIRFIIMSATLPKIGQLKIEEMKPDDVVYLLPNARTDYFNNINFAGRVQFDFSLADRKLSLTELAREVFETSVAQAEIDGGTSKPRHSIHTIVEFIFKNTATYFQQEMERIHDGFFDEIFVLSGTILSHRRQHIINFLKRKESRKKRILLITTQVVEAGVDIDMDLGFKDTSLLDSDEQLAGRINRNVKKEGCKLFLFDYNRESLIYKSDLRLEFTKQMTFQEKEEILKTKNFDLLYQKIIEFKNKRNADLLFVGLSQYTDLIENLQFQSVSEEFQLIEQENFSCYIPMNIPVTVVGESADHREDIFTGHDLTFLESYGILPDEENQVSGASVFDLYLDLIHSAKPFMDKHLDLKQLQFILSKFVFSVFASDKMKNALIPYMDLEKSEYGYFYMERWSEFYDETYGIDESSFDNVENQFL